MMFGKSLPEVLTEARKISIVIEKMEVLFIVFLIFSIPIQSANFH